MTVYVAFCRAKGNWLSRLITWATGQGPSHAFLAYRDDGLWGCAMQVSAEAGGLMVLPASNAGAVSAAYRLPAYDLVAALRANRGALGQGYDFAGLLGMAPVMAAWLLFRWKVRNLLQSSSRWFCSEYTAEVLRTAGVPLPFEPGDMDPGRLEDAVVAAGGERVEWSEVIA